MRIRSIKPEFWRSVDVCMLIREDRLLFIALWTYVDDNGVGRDELPLIIGDLFSNDMVVDPAGTVEYVKKGLAALADRHLIVRYRVAGRPYLAISNWRHQKIDHPATPRYPQPDEALLDAARESVAKSSRDLRETLAPVTGEQGNRGSEDQGKRARKRATRIPENWQMSDDVRAWAASKAPSVDIDDEAERFVNYWLAESTAKAAKLDWQRTFQVWVGRQHRWNVERGWQPPVAGVDEWKLR